LKTTIDYLDYCFKNFPSETSVDGDFTIKGDVVKKIVKKEGLCQIDKLTMYLNNPFRLGQRTLTNSEYKLIHNGVYCLVGREPTDKLLLYIESTRKETKGNTNQILALIAIRIRFDQFAPKLFEPTWMRISISRKTKYDIATERSL